MILLTLLHTIGMRGINNDIIFTVYYQKVNYGN